MSETYNTKTRISYVRNDPVFQDYGRLIFPVDSGYMSGDTLGNLRLTWYNYIDPDKTVEICNYMRHHAGSGDTIFYDIYTDEEKAADPWKEDTGLFFFKGNPGEKFAIVNAGGGFAYVGAMHDSFPHALELSKKGYNAFALIYRPSAQTACEDLARAIAFIFEHAEELEVDTSDYSLWGGSAGGRMAAWLGTYGTESFGEQEYPHPAAVIVNYTGLSEVTGYEPPTYSAVGTSDGIASWRTMESRINAIKADVLDMILTEHPEIEIVQIQLNYVDYEDASVESRKVYEVCEKHGKPVIVMEPVKGGSLVNLPEEADKILRDLGGGSNASYAIRFAASFPNIAMVLSGMSDMSQMEDNISAMQDFKPLSEVEMDAVHRVCDIFRNLHLIPCTSCRYCIEESECPKGIRIPDMFSSLNAHEAFHNWNTGYYYNNIITGNGHGKASECIKCGKCERVCPQHLPIRELLTKVAKTFEG